MRTWGSNHRICELSCWKSISWNYSMSFHVIHKIITFKNQFFFLGWCYNELFSLQNSWKLGGILFFGGLLFITTKSSFHNGLNLNFKFVNMSELEFFLKGVITKNSNTMELAYFPEKIQNFHIHTRAVTLKMTLCRTMRPKKSWKKSEDPRLCRKNELLYWHPTFNPQAV
jgi:hypothetical protein